MPEPEAAAAGSSCSWGGLVSSKTRARWSVYAALIGAARRSLANDKARAGPTQADPNTCKVR
eukprot:7742610-Alexandrium_andersonii.AAC.1